MNEIEMGEENDMQIWMNDKWVKYKLGRANERQTQVNEIDLKYEWNIDMKQWIKQKHEKWTKYRHEWMKSKSISKQWKKAMT